MSLKRRKPRDCPTRHSGKPLDVPNRVAPILNHHARMRFRARASESNRCVRAGPAATKARPVQEEDRWKDDQSAVRRTDHDGGRPPESCLSRDIKGMRGLSPAERNRLLGKQTEPIRPRRSSRLPDLRVCIVSKQLRRQTRSSALRSDGHEEASVKTGARRLRDFPDIHSA
jgi:hypothetical protein